MADNFSDFPKPEADPEEGSVFDYIMLIIAGLFALWGTYTSFVIVGGLAGKFLDDSMFRLLATLGLTVVLPIATGIGSFGESDHFHDRLRRLLVTVTVLTMGTGLAIGVALTKHTVPEMYSNPNWFLKRSNPNTESGLAKMNRKYTSGVANLSEQIAYKVGLYDHKPRRLGSKR